MKKEDLTNFCGSISTSLHNPGIFTYLATQMAKNGKNVVYIDFEDSDLEDTIFKFKDNIDDR